MPLGDLMDEFSLLGEPESGIADDVDLSVESAAMPGISEVQDRPDDWPHCEVCGKPCEWTGRGRRPKKCEDHKRRASTSAGVRRAGGRSVDQRAEAIRKSLDVELFKFGAVLTRVLPVTGMTISGRSEKTATALVTLAARKPEYLDALEKVAALEPAMDLAEFVGAVALAVGVDFKQVNPEGVAARSLGVTEAWQELVDNDIVQISADQSEPRAAGPQFGPGPLPIYQPIGVGVV